MYTWLLCTVEARWRLNSAGRVCHVPGMDINILWRWSSGYQLSCPNASIRRGLLLPSAERPKSARLNPLKGSKEHSWTAPTHSGGRWLELWRGVVVVNYHVTHLSILKIILHWPTDNLGRGTPSLIFSYVVRNWFYIDLLTILGRGTPFNFVICCQEMNLHWPTDHFGMGTPFNCVICC